MTRRGAALQLFRYGLVGLVSNGALYAAYLILTAAGLGAKLTMTLLYVAGVVQTFLFNKRWTFGHDGSHRAAFVRYCISYALGYLLNLLVLYVLVDRLGFRHQIVQGAMIVGLAIMLFLLQKYWVFRANASLSTSGTAQS
ncbi:MAG: GtrA family protein [Propionivibrio sp.]